MPSRSKEILFSYTTEYLSTQEAYSHSFLIRKLEAMDRRVPETRFAIITDYDNSLYHIKTAEQTRELLATSDRVAVPVVVVTGNNLTNLQRKCKDQGIEMPDVVLSSVGTEVWIKQLDGSFKEDTHFPNVVRAESFNRKEIASIGTQLIAAWKLDEQKQDALFEFQDRESERAFLNNETTRVEGKKVSFHFYAHDDELEQVVSAFERAFTGHPIVWCEEVEFNDNPDNDVRIRTGVQRKKYCADVLAVPPKVAAANYIIELCSIQDAVVVGDSGNDLDLLRETAVGVRVVVSGAKPELGRRVLAGTTKHEALSALDSQIAVYQTIEGHIILYILNNNPDMYAAASIQTALRTYVKILQSTDKKELISILQNFIGGFEKA